MLLVMSVASCADSDRLAIYEAEKLLFKAGKLEAKLGDATLPSRSEFLSMSRTVYRAIVTRYAPYMQNVEGMESIVLDAQLRLAKLELKTGMFAEARDDFLKVLDIERTIPDARMEATIAAARISEQIDEPEQAFDLYQAFYVEFLSLESAQSTARTRPEGLEAPLRMAALCVRIDRKDEGLLWLETAQTFFEYLIEQEEDPTVLRTSRFYLLETLILGEKWDEALGLSRSLTSMYREEESRTKLLLIEAGIHQNGKHDARTAGDLYRHIYEQFPKSREAPGALLAHANLRLSFRDTTDAVSLFARLSDEFPSEAEVVAPAEWQLALIEERRGDWMSASLRYKSLSRRFPGTQAAFDAPLKLAEGYMKLGANDSAEATYRKAVVGYARIVQGPFPVLAKLAAEDYIVRVFKLQGRWEDAARHLVEIANRYPLFEGLHDNYLAAADIFENELADRDEAADILITCIERFPNTDTAREAQRRLAALKP
jgi:TolA-binding protein